MATALLQAESATYKGICFIKTALALGGESERERGCVALCVLLGAGLLAAAAAAGWLQLLGGLTRPVHLFCVCPSVLHLLQACTYLHLVPKVQLPRLYSMQIGLPPAVGAALLLKLRC